MFKSVKPCRGFAVIHPFVSLVLTLATSIAAPSASIAADVAKGAQLARQWCANCHVIEGSGATTVQQGPPSFRSIGLSGDQLRTFLTHPHGAMPDFALPAPGSTI